MISAARILGQVPHPAETGDGGWVSRAQAGDRAAFENLYRQYAGRIHALCLRMVADPTLAETLTQDAFLRAWRKLGSFRAEGEFGAWLHRLAVNTVIEDRRKAARERKFLASPRFWGGRERGGEESEAGFAGELLENGRLECGSQSGDIRVILPADLDAEVEIGTFSGDIESDFGPRRKPRKGFGPGEELEFILGDGDLDIELGSFSGDIRLIKK